MKYRPEIDGLRAIAVLSVVIYHAKFIVNGDNILSGGYLGVDIFFVISGYLITSILLREIEQKRFSFLSFYERRARRILPALFLMMLVSIPFAWIILLPDAMQQYGGSALSSLGFVSNIFFWLEDSYTAAPSQLKPLLHTWSLSVEEQFYLFFPPLLLVLSRRFTAYALKIILFLTVLSLALAQYGVGAFSDANFFLIFSRMWELLLGAVLAKLQADRHPYMAKFDSAFLSLAALFALLLSIALFNQTTAHPSLLTAIPVLSTVVLIANQKHPRLIYGFLSARPMVFIGLISYSLYLWHFPIFAFARVQSLELSTVTKLALISVSFCLAIAAYFVVEKPLRNRERWSSRAISLMLLVCLLGLTSIFSYLYVSKGAPQRLGSVANLFEQAKANVVANGDYNTGSSETRIINVGDSHAEIFGGSLERLAAEYSLGFTQMTQSGCPLAPGVFRYDQGKLNSRCSDLQDRWLKHALSYPESIFVYSSRFSLYLSGERFDNGEGGREAGPSLLITTENSAQVNVDGVRQRVQSAIEQLLQAGHKVVLVYPVPEVGWNVPNLVKSRLSSVPAGLKMSKFESLNISTSYQQYKLRSKAAYKLYDSIPDSPNLLRFYPSQYLCDESTGRCATHDGLNLYYYDDNHLTPYFASKLMVKLESLMLPLGWLNKTPLMPKDESASASD